MKAEEFAEKHFIHYWTDERVEQYARKFAAEQLAKAVSIADDVLNTPTILTRFNTASEIKKRLLLLAAELEKDGGQG